MCFSVPQTRDTETTKDLKENDSRGKTKRNLAEKTNEMEDFYHNMSTEADRMDKRCLKRQHDHSITKIDNMHGTSSIFIFHAKPGGENNDKTDYLLSQKSSMLSPEWSRKKERKTNQNNCAFNNREDFNAQDVTSEPLMARESDIYVGTNNLCGIIHV